MCFFLSLLLAKRRSQPSNSHWNGFSPAEGKHGHQLWTPRPPGELPPTPEEARPLGRGKKSEKGLGPLNRWVPSVAELR